jgi:hypothetical protein
MKNANAKTLGLSHVEARLLRALFQYNDAAGTSRGERRAWLLAQIRASEGRRVLRSLVGAGLVSESYRLTWLGLTLAVNLPQLGSSLSDVLAA